MKWWRKWSFVIMLAMTGIMYYGVKEGIPRVIAWQDANLTGEEQTGENWQQETDAAAPEDPTAPEEDTGESEEIPQPTATPEPVPEETPQPTATPEPTPTPEPEIRIGRVEDDYFSDALFLGDSRTVGMQKYGELGETATFYASTGLTIYKLFSAEIAELPDQSEKVTVEEALQHQSFGKIYIMIGINEIGGGTTEGYAQTYGETVAHLQELQPDAIIYIQGILKVTAARSAKGDYINNESIAARNEALSQLADGKKIFYLDVNEALCDESGGMVKDYTSDGVHLKAKYISLWEEYLKDHAVLLD